MTTPQDGEAGRAEGEHRKKDAHDLLEVRRQGVLRRARRAMLHCLLEVGRATADDAAEAIGPVSGIDPRWRGAVPGPLAKAGIIRDTGSFVKSTRPKAHARRIIVWELADRGAALAWLARHPEPPDEDEPPALGPVPEHTPTPRPSLSASTHQPTHF